jgi:hypothetical protein
MLFKRILRALLRPVYHIVCVRLFSLWESMGFHITPDHFYQPIPDTRTLKDELWLRQSELIGLDMNEQNQIQLLNQFLRFKDEYDSFPKNEAKRPYHYYLKNGFFESVDAEILYCMIRHFKPKKIIEIGSGFSTFLSAQAILKNEEENGYKRKLIAIDPYPSKILRSGFPGLSKLIPAKVEEIDLSMFNELEENDILFIDSGHVLKIGNDVQYEYLEILPRLNKGVIFHIHDIFLPKEYPQKWVLKMHRFWNEQYLLQSFLAFNSTFKVLWAGSYMHLKHPEKLKQAFSSYDRRTVWPCSFWVRREL